MEKQYIGVDLHKASFQACAIDATGTRLWEASLPRDATGLNAFAARGIVEAHVAVEATGRRGRLWMRCTPRAHASVSGRRKTRLKVGFAAKTDRLDARRLADALRRESVVSIDIPPRAIRELRELCRGRQQLVRTRTKLVQMIRAMLLRQDLADPPRTQLMTPRGLAWLERITPPGGHRGRDAGALDAGAAHRAGGVPRGARARRRGGGGRPDRRRLDDTGRGGSRLEPDPAGGDRDDRALRPRPLPRELCRAGARCRRASATRVRSGAITRAGSPWLRWALVEAAVHGLKRRDAIGRWARRLAMQNGVPKARVAVARRLCDEIVQVWPRLG